MRKLLALFAAIIAMAVLISFAEKASGENTEFPFALNLIYPETQIEAEAGYFYIDLKADETAELSFEVQNNVAKEISIDIETADCYTSPQGGLIYVSGNPGADISITDGNYAMADNISPSTKRLTLKPNEKSIVSIKITAPYLQEGELIGAVRFVDTSPMESASPENNSNIQVNVKRAITIPIRVRLSLTQSVNMQAIAIGEASVVADKGKITLAISNNMPIINREAKINYEVMDSFGKKLFENSLNLDKMAPKTSVIVPLDWEDSALNPGKYILKVTYSKSETATETVEREIDISKTDADAIDIKPTTPEVSGGKSGNKLVYYGVVISLIAIIVILALLLYRKRKNL